MMKIIIFLSDSGKEVFRLTNADEYIQKFKELEAIVKGTFFSTNRK